MYGSRAADNAGGGGAEERQSSAPHPPSASSADASAVEAGVWLPEGSGGGGVGGTGSSDEERHRRIEQFRERTGMDSLDFIHDLNARVDPEAKAALIATHTGGTVSDVDEGELWASASQDMLAAAAAAEGPGGAATRAFVERFESRRSSPSPPPEAEAEVEKAEVAKAEAELKQPPEAVAEPVAAPEAEAGSALEAVLAATAVSASASAAADQAAAETTAAGGGSSGGSGALSASALAAGLESAMAGESAARDNVRRDIALLEDLAAALAALRGAEARGAPEAELSAARGALLAHMEALGAQLDQGYQRLDGVAGALETLRRVKAGQVGGRGDCGAGHGGAGPLTTPACGT
ncbi:hypothetical protein GPECTOR_25g393 [Gonium pectorale]|uniref:Uncharacterized protein n=1 Tax=Gonium pectorale TaxID=33097 RepID=A0A150GG41_GONPE|nr:hypothetical protein GPECTOR_25g393 [Gonium pectorale]|eukprot:KXZ48809.1 hypothetical protein GPECTOR_25g393 [Gonium pectorale]